MAENTKIEWCDHTFNAWTGCQAVSPGCDNCYAAAWAKRAGRDFAVRQRTTDSYWQQPRKWDARHEAFFAAHGRRQRVFVNSLSDVFDNAAPPTWRIELFALIAETPHLDWLLLTKRIGNAAKMIETAVEWERHKVGTIAGKWPWPNVWMMATVCNQPEADRDIVKLLAVPAAKHGISVGPMLSAIDITPWLPHDKDEAPGYVTRLDWVICEGESTANARPMHPAWVRSLRDQCDEVGTRFFFKQWGCWAPADAISDDDNRVLPELWLRQDGSTNNTGEIDFFGGDTVVYHVGKKAVGRLLDGRTWEQAPP